MKIKRRAIKKLFIASLFLFPFAFFSSKHSPWIMRGPAVWLGEVLYPVEYLMGRSKKVFSHFVYDYFFLKNQIAQNYHLQTQVDLLTQKLVDYEKLEQEVKSLRDLLAFSTTFQSTLTEAVEVINSSFTQAFHSMRISKGSLDGFSPGMPVISSKGVVGKVIRTSLHFSDVQLLTDNNFYLDVYVVSTSTRGIIRGIARNRCQLKLHKRASVKIGDMVAVSGIIDPFPRGLIVGKVVKISFASDEVEQVILIEPSVDLASLEKALVVKESDPQLEMIKDIAGSEWIDELSDTHMYK